MKKFHVTFIITILIFSNYIFAQQTFEKIISKPEDQKINSIIEDTLGYYCMVGKIKNINTGLYAGYLVRIDSLGNLMNEKEFQDSDTTPAQFFNIHFINNKYYIIGSKSISNEEPQIAKLWFLQLDENLEIENEKLLSIPYGRWFSYMNSIFDTDSNFVITGYTTRNDTNHNGNHFYNNDAFFYKLNISGDSINSVFYTSYVPYYFSFDIIENHDSSKYYAFVSHFTNTFGTSGQMLTLNKNLDSLDIDSIPLDVYDFYSPVYISQNKLLICGKRGAEPPNDYALNVLTITDSCELINYNTFKKYNLRDHPVMHRGISKKGTNIYIGGTSNFDYANPFWSTFDSWFHLIKINPDISPIWEYWYGGDAYYFLYTILATNDGGCIMVGNRYDYETQNQERDIYIVKVDSNGLITWTQEIPTDKPETTVYPNPGTNVLNIKNDNKLLDFELINLNGQIVIRQIVNNNINTINTESLKPGMYFYKLNDNKNKTFETGKWIKK
jgi:hypothetical protein